MQKNVYVILSHAGTITAGLIKRVTHAEYSHASICFDDSFKEFYSFGRRFMLTPLFGGFVRETLDTGMLGHYQTSQICILKIETTAEKYYKAKAYSRAPRIQAPSALDTRNGSNTLRSERRMYESPCK